MSYSGTLSAVGNVSSVITLGRDDFATISLTNTGGHLWSVVLEESVGGQAWRLLATYSSNQSAISFLPPQRRPSQVRLRLATVNASDTIAASIAALTVTTGHTVTLVGGEPEIIFP